MNRSSEVRKGACFMKRKAILSFLVFCLGVITLAYAQTQKALTNSDVVTMTKQGFDAGLIVKAIESSATEFDVSAQALIELRNAGVQQPVMEAMLSAQANKP